METPDHIDFQGLNANELFLEGRYGRITSCVSWSKRLANATKRAAFMKSTSASPCRKAARSTLIARRRRTNVMQTLILRSTMHSSGRAGACKTTPDGCGQVKAHGGQPIGTATRLEGDRGADDPAR